MLSDNIDHSLGGCQVVLSALAPNVVRGKVPGQEDVINVAVTLGDRLHHLELNKWDENGSVPQFFFGENGETEPILISPNGIIANLRF